MKLTYLRILNFRSCRDVSLEIGDMHALVGANNAGKSTVLRALDFLFNPSVKSLDEESFWNKDSNLEIRVEACFSDLTEDERESLGACLRPDGTFYMARYARALGKNGYLESGSQSGDSKIEISQQYKAVIPEPEWLQESEINGNRITEWWGEKDKLKVGGARFAEDTKKKPGVGDWKAMAKQFLETNADRIPLIEKWIDNPQGYPNVLKRTLPCFVLVPAVRDVTDEAKGTKTSPFGRLLYAILDTVAEEKKAKIEGMLRDVANTDESFWRRRTRAVDSGN